MNRDIPALPLDPLANNVGPNSVGEGWGVEQKQWEFRPVVWVLSDVEVYPDPIPGRGFPGLYCPEKQEAFR